eukprot:TRINITY_DN23645_c0_g1_i1.p2 TRINITY_DN23645_c0_g1~~TRINITY_DN23645_c0_g1_i1.p2  ORF type:complete len:138 (+),score=3.47 TRINITY_DN23645_c0_g1_i1:264-677(+)
MAAAAAAAGAHTEEADLPMTRPAMRSTSMRAAGRISFSATRMCLCLWLCKAELISLLNHVNKISRSFRFFGEAENHVTEEEPLGSLRQSRPRPLTGCSPASSLLCKFFQFFRERILGTNSRCFGVVGKRGLPPALSH